MVQRCHDLRASLVQQTREFVGEEGLPLVRPEDIIVLRPEDGADVQRLTRVIERLAAAGFVNLVLAE